MTRGVERFRWACRQNPQPRAFKTTAEGSHKKQAKRLSTKLVVSFCSRIRDVIGWADRLQYFLSQRKRGLPTSHGENWGVAIGDFSPLAPVS